MTGPEHYRMAETIVASAEDRNMPSDAVEAIAACARVHATLALAAATALGEAAYKGMGSADWEAWREVAGAREAGVRQ
jgi:hypothetical protein